MTEDSTKPTNKYFCNRCKDQNFLIQCECGTCEDVIPRYHSNGVYRKYAFNHHFRLAKNKRDQRGEKNYRWKGGMYFDDGYWMLTGKGDHPNAQKSDGHIPRHVYNFTVREGVLFCCMLPWGRVHHKKPIKEGGTDDLDNLEGMMLSKHLSHHHKGLSKPGNKKNFGGRICLLCGAQTTYINKGDGCEVWYKYENGFICMKCYNKNK
jgi:hypothetical protein